MQNTLKKAIETEERIKNLSSTEAIQNQLNQLEQITNIVKQSINNV